MPPTFVTSGWTISKARPWSQGTNGFACCSYNLLVHRVALPAERSPANLKCPKAFLADGQQMVCECPRLAHQHGRIGKNATAVATAQEPADRLSNRLAQNVPESYVD